MASHGVPKVDWDVIIADESHKLKNVYSSQRSKMFAKIARYQDPAEKAPFVIYASATIGQDPAELAYMAPLIAQLTRNHNMSEIKNWESLARKVGIHGEKNKDLNKYVWTQDTKEQKHNLQVINKLLFSKSSPSIRRLPSQIAGWPEHNYVILPFELEEEGYDLYDSMWTEFVEEMELDKARKNPKGLAIQIRFRQKTSILKVDNTIDLALDYLENNRKVIISVDFKESVEMLRTRLEAHNYTVEEFNGRNVNTREEARNQIPERSSRCHSLQRKRRGIIPRRRTASRWNNRGQDSKRNNHPRYPLHRYRNSADIRTCPQGRPVL